MTAIAAKAPASGRAGLLEKLMAAVRPEFRHDIFVPDQDDPVLGWTPCFVAGCDRPCVEYALCRGHGQRWRKRGCPDREVFLADPGPPLRGRCRLSGCTVPTCRFGASGRGLCARHRDKWQRGGRPDPAVWAANAAPLVDPDEQTECRLSFCDMWVEGGNELCKAHHTRWRQDGFGDLEEFITECERHGKAFADFRGLPAQVKLELRVEVEAGERVRERSVVRHALHARGHGPAGRRRRGRRRDGDEAVDGRRLARRRVPSGRLGLEVHRRRSFLAASWDLLGCRC